MPLTRVSLRRGKPATYRQAILDGIYRAMREVFDVPEEDRFMVINEHDETDFSYSKTYLDIARTDDLILIQITANNTRTTERKETSSRIPSATRRPLRVESSTAGCVGSRGSSVSRERDGRGVSFLRMASLPARW